MKNSFFILMLLFALNGFSQSNNVQSAANSLKTNDFAEAKQYIDMAAQHEKTANDPKMWYYRGKIYLNIHIDTALNKIDSDAVEKAAVSFINYLKSGNSYFADECKKLVWVCGIGLFDKAADAFIAKDYSKAIRYYNKIFDVFPFDMDNNLKHKNITSEIIYKNLYIISLKIKDTEKAKEYLQKLIDAKYNDAMIYSDMAGIYLEQKDTVKALTYIEQGRKLFEDNANLFKRETDIYLKQGKIDVLINKFTEAVKITPDNEVLYYCRGLLYENTKSTVQAAEDYKKAIDLKPDYFDANYVLGVLYFNQGADIINAANDLKNDMEYQKAKANGDEKLKQAVPYLEKALELNPKDMNTLKTLKQLYARTGDNEKYNKIKNMMEGKK